MTLRQDQQARVVGQQGTPTPALLEIPADKSIAVLQMKGRRAPGRQRQPLAFVGGHVTQLLAHQGGILEVMMLDNEFIAPRLVLGLSLIHISEPTRRTPISYAVFC